MKNNENMRALNEMELEAVAGGFPHIPMPPLPPEAFPPRPNND